jgi:hypothetical protein
MVQTEAREGLWVGTAAANKKGGYISQLHVTIMKDLRQLTSQREKAYLAHSLGGSQSTIG